MKYRTFEADIFYNEDYQEFCGKVLDKRCNMTFSGKSVDELKMRFRECVEEYFDPDYVDEGASRR